MELSIKATLTNEELEILATQKGWTETVTETNEIKENGEFRGYGTVEIKNPLTASEFIVNVYQSMIVQDVTKVFTEYRTQKLKQQIALTEQSVRESVESSITSSIV